MNNGQSHIRRWGFLGSGIGVLVGCCGGGAVLGAVVGTSVSLSTGATVGIFIGLAVGGAVVGGGIAWGTCKLINYCRTNSSNSPECCQVVVPNSNTHSNVLRSLPSGSLEHEESLSKVQDEDIELDARKDDQRRSIETVLPIATPNTTGTTDGENDLIEQEFQSKSCHI